MKAIKKTHVYHIIMMTLFLFLQKCLDLDLFYDLAHPPRPSLLSLAYVRSGVK